MRKIPPNLPDIVLIGVDKWTFDYRRPDIETSKNEQKSIIGEYERHFNRKYLRLMEIFTIENLKRLKMEKHPDAIIKHTTDGIINNSAHEPIKKIKEYVENEFISHRVQIVDYDKQITHENFREFKRFQTFENFIQTLLERNITVIFYCEPYHPLAYSKSQEVKEKDPTTLSLEDLEKYVRDFAKENGILVIGSYNPHAYNLTGSDMYNEDHAKPQAVAKIISAHSHELYDLLYTDIYPTYEEYATALAESQAELLF
jgi:hypothetical protein